MMTAQRRPIALLFSPVSMKAEVEDEKKRSSRGRQKIPMQRIEDRDRRSVAYSKRRKSLFGKAAKLCAITGAEVAVLTFSPGGRAFAFGHTSVDSVLRRFLLGRLGEPAAGAGVEEMLRLVPLEPDGGAGLEVLQSRLEELEMLQRLVRERQERVEQEQEQEASLKKKEQEQEAIREASISMMMDHGVATSGLDDIPHWAKD